MATFIRNGDTVFNLDAIAHIEIKNEQATITFLLPGVAPITLGKALTKALLARIKIGETARAG